MATRRIALVLLLSGVFMAEQASAQDSLAAARDLYTSAQYDEALKVLDRLSPEASSNDERQSVDLYRTLCLLAVGRRDDADRAIEAIIARDPLYRPSQDLSPRMLTAFSDARKRVLPVLVQQQYAAAKDAFDRKEFEPASKAFKRVIDALKDPDIELAAAQPPLADLRSLSAGFYELSLKSIPPPPAPPPAPVAAPVAVPAPPRIYGGEEAGVRHPVTIDQDMPRYPGPVPASGIKGLIEVVIDENGSVESAVIIASVSSAYDKLLLNAANKWRFAPATANGAPVKFRKRIQINIAPPTY
jgi:TonB family protein